MAGYTPGLTTTDGVYIDGQRTVEGDMTGPVATRMVLADPTIDIAVLEVARGGLLRAGMGVPWVNVGAVLNVKSDHLGMKGIETLEQLAEVKRIVVEVARDCAVLNADDLHCLRMADHTEAARIAYVTMNPRHDLVRKHLRAGGLAAVRKQFDIFGVLVLAWAAGLGGGMLRDVLIGATPPVGISDWRFISVACLAGVVMYFFNPRLARARRMILVLDAGALALFAVSGTLKALELGLNGVAAVCAGIITGIGGGVLRDLLIGEVPVVLHERQLYAVPAVVGAVLTAVLWATDVLTVLTALGSVVVVFALRIAALRFRLQAPGPWVVGSRQRRASGRMER